MTMCRRSVSCALTPPLPPPVAQDTPGPGTYEITSYNSMTTLLKSNSDKPMPAFRSQTSRFPGPHPKFTTADPLHLEPGSNRPRDVQNFVQATPVAFKRGSSSNLMLHLNGAQ